MSKKILSIQNLTKIFKDNKHSNEILSNVNLDIEENEFLCILGPSGCGKTTLLRCIAGLEKYTGSIILDGKKVIKPGVDRTMVFQNFEQLFPWKTVRGNIEIGLKNAGVRDREQLEDTISLYLSKVGLYAYKDYFPHQLSGGMKQRVAIARALSMRPKMILMDEPFASLDAMTRETLQKEIAEIKEQEDITIVFVTHNIQEALILGTRNIVLGAGGEIKLDILNDLMRPVTPASKGYGEMWDVFFEALKREKAYGIK